jgi:hypothetical protein
MADDSSMLRLVRTPLFMVVLLALFSGCAVIAFLSRATIVVSDQVNLGPSAFAYISSILGVPLTVITLYVVMRGLIDKQNQRIKEAVIAEMAGLKSGIVSDIANQRNEELEKLTDEIKRWLYWQDGAIECMMECLLRPVDFTDKDEAAEMLKERNERLRAVLLKRIPGGNPAYRGGSNLKSRLIELLGWLENLTGRAGPLPVVEADEVH